MYDIDIKKVKNDLIEWIKNWFEENGKGCNAIIGLSGGKDSTIVAKLCVEALGKEHVIGVAMPDTFQGLNDADKIAEYLGIRFINAPIGKITAGFHDLFDERPVTEQTIQNIPPRVRMTTLYAIAQSYNGRVIGTCNLSENYIGYFTAWGDGVSDCEPIANLTVTEVRALGDELGLPMEWVYKMPDDGLPMSCSDEAKFGFTYDVLDKYIREGVCDDKEIKNKIDARHNKNLFKMKRMYLPSFLPYFMLADYSEQTRQEEWLWKLRKELLTGENS